MTGKYYSIGEFAAVNKISPRMLRHYDKIGLLKPAAILENGYRAYNSDQIERVSSIRLYQSCGFTLAEVMLLLGAGEAGVQQAAKDKLAELDQLDETQLLAREQLLTFAKGVPRTYTNHYDISYTRQSELLLFCCAAPVTEAEIEAAIKRLYRAIAAQGASPDGFLLLLSDLETANAYRVAVPVKESLACDGYECVALEAGWYLSTMHHGDYFSIGKAYDSLLRYTMEKEHSLKPPFMERYLLDAKNTSSPTQYHTQIFVQHTP